MASFQIAFAKTSQAEGGYSNSAADKGGETYRGISRKNFPNWAGWKIIDDLKRATGFPAILATDTALNNLVAPFYKVTFWDSLNLDLANNQDNANKLYDAAVNVGKAYEGTCLQRALNVLNQNGRYYPDLKVDGQVGPVTIAALNKHPNPANVHKVLDILQGYRYVTLAEADPSQEIFMNGWIANRIGLAS